MTSFSAASNAPWLEAEDPVMKPPPCTHTITARGRSASAGTHTFRYRQSSLCPLLGNKEKHAGLCSVALITAGSDVKGTVFVNLERHGGFTVKRTSGDRCCPDTDKPVKVSKHGA